MSEDLRALLGQNEEETSTFGAFEQPDTKVHELATK